MIEFIKTHVLETIAAIVATTIIALCSIMLIKQRHEINNKSDLLAKTSEVIAPIETLINRLEDGRNTEDSEKIGVSVDQLILCKESLNQLSDSINNEQR